MISSANTKRARFIDILKIPFQNNCKLKNSQRETLFSRPKMVRPRNCILRCRKIAEYKVAFNSFLEIKKNTTHYKLTFWRFIAVHELATPSTPPPSLPARG
jgi:hypothetical protein